MATGMGAKRLGKELQKMQRGMPHGITIVKADDFREWLLDIQVFDNPIYEGQTFRLSLLFGGNYPIGKCLTSNELPRTLQSMNLAR